MLFKIFQLKFTLLRQLYFKTKGMYDKTLPIYFLISLPRLNYPKQWACFMTYISPKIVLNLSTH